MAELNAPLASPVLPGDSPEWRPHAAVVSWSAVFAGAVAAAAFGLVLLTLGAGLGLAALSPWHSATASGAAFGVAAIIWVCVTQVLTSGLGGYLAGRLRHRWPAVHVDETYFRDTAHGFLSWALATLATAALFAAVLPAAEHAGGRMAAQAGSAGLLTDRGDANAAVNQWPVGYYVDALFRPPVQSSASSPVPSAPAGTSAAPAISAPASSAASSSASSATSNASAPIAPVLSPAPNSDAASGAIVTPVATPALAAIATSEPPTATSGPSASGLPPKHEVTRIFMNSLATNDSLSAADIAYVATIVSRYTGMSPQAAQVRVAATYSQLQQKMIAIEGAAKDAANRARRASVSAALWLFVSLLMGAFSACFMAVFGGRLRDV